MRGRGGDHFPLNFQVLQSSSCYLAKAGERAEDQSEQGGGLRQNLEIHQQRFRQQETPIQKTHQPNFCDCFPRNHSKYKVLLEGFHDKDSPLHRLRAPNNVVNDVMPIVWEYLTSDWQVSLYFLGSPNLQAFGIKRELVQNIGWLILNNFSVNTLQPPFQL